MQPVLAALLMLYFASRTHTTNCLACDPIESLSKIHFPWIRCPCHPLRAFQSSRDDRYRLTSARDKLSRSRYKLSRSPFRTTSFRMEFVLPDIIFSPMTPYTSLPYPCLLTLSQYHVQTPSTTPRSTPLPTSTLPQFHISTLSHFSKGNQGRKRKSILHSTHASVIETVESRRKVKSPYH